MQSGLTNLELRFQTAAKAIPRARHRKQVPLTGKRHPPGGANDSATTQKERAGASGGSRTGRYLSGQTSRREGLSPRTLFFQIQFSPGEISARTTRRLR